MTALHLQCAVFGEHTSYVLSNRLRNAHVGVREDLLVVYLKDVSEDFVEDLWRRCR